jgi:xylan 1,4-beta-xylosidase
MVGRAVKKVHDQVVASSRPALPIIWSEYNASYMNEVPVTDSPFMGPWLANTIRQCDGLTTAMSYWTFSDVFEEQGVVKQPFYGGYGLIAEDGIPKAAYNAFKLLHWLGHERIPVDGDALVTRRPDGTLAIAVWNYTAPEETGSPRQLRLAIRGIEGIRRARIEIVDQQHGSALAAWEAMGRPVDPTRAQIRQLRISATTLDSSTALLQPDDPTVTLTLRPKALALVQIGP